MLEGTSNSNFKMTARDVMRTLKTFFFLSWEQNYTKNLRFLSQDVSTSSSSSPPTVEANTSSKRHAVSRDSTADIDQSMYESAVDSIDKLAVENKDGDGDTRSGTSAASATAPSSDSMSGSGANVLDREDIYMDDDFHEGGDGNASGPQWVSGEKKKF